MIIAKITTPPLLYGTSFVQALGLDESVLEFRRGNIEALKSLPPDVRKKFVEDQGVITLEITINREDYPKSGRLI